MKHTAPPLTRGSTRDSRRKIDDFSGSPAHAGIDPAHGVAGGVVIRLPRSRGDRPATPTLPSPTQAAPPLTRGSTHSRLEHGRAFDGSPAHAGIDPAPGSCRAGSARLPRSRGDRPLTQGLPDWSKPAPPLTRGSTPLLLDGGLADRGSPAHAGIDPTLPNRSRSPAGLPRSRGDRPGAGRASRPQHEAPPLTRGSTPSAPGVARTCRGSPAHAGIDPLEGPGARRCCGLPRSRGDRPFCPWIDHVYSVPFEIRQIAGRQGGTPRPCNGGNLRIGGRWAGRLGGGLPRSPRTPLPPRCRTAGCRR